MQQSRCTLDGKFNDMPFYSCDNRFNYIFFGADSSWLIAIGSDPRSSDEFRIVSKNTFYQATSDSCPPVFTEWSNGIFLSCGDYKTERISQIRNGCLSILVYRTNYSVCTHNYSPSKDILTVTSVAGVVMSMHIAFKLMKNLHANVKKVSLVTVSNV